MFKFEHKTRGVMMLNNPDVQSVMSFEFELTKSAQKQIGL